FNKSVSMQGTSFRTLVRRHRLSLSLCAIVAAFAVIFPACGGSPTDTGAGSAAKLSITTQPSASAQTGVQFAQQPVIQLEDFSGNAVSQAGVVVTAAIASGAGTLGGTSTATTSSSGVATLTNLAITGTGGTQLTLSFSASGLTGANSGTITINAVATQIAVNGGNNQTAAAGSAVATAPSV